ncbi:hypothetical protein SAMN05444851_0345 [Aliiroseovarius sediminilitoris]|uniref:Uncharacterized protein n=1 Tax=Aliiroseovarius sediminilitoris TaxID=1173584 RepID=A0A1I0MVW0_9RHOB|nr:hypothetical protein SAMN05444851_0345 [Aliiroseovarius sediminilitoris]
MGRGHHDGQQSPGKNYASRSELVYAAVIWMLFRGMQPGHVLSIIMSPDVGISFWRSDAWSFNPNSPTSSSFVPVLGCGTYC